MRIVSRKEETKIGFQACCPCAARHRTQADVNQSLRTNHPKAKRFHYGIPIVEPITNMPQVVPYKS